MNKREKARRAKAFALAVEQTKHIPKYSAQSEPWQDRLALHQQSLSLVVDKTVHPIVKGDQEYWYRLDMRDKRRAQGGTHERLHQAAKGLSSIAPPNESLYRCLIGRGRWAHKWGCTYAG